MTSWCETIVNIVNFFTSLLSFTPAVLNYSEAIYSLKNWTPLPDHIRPTRAVPVGVKVDLDGLSKYEAHELFQGTFGHHQQLSRGIYGHPPLFDHQQPPNDHHPQIDYQDSPSDNRLVIDEHPHLRSPATNDHKHPIVDKHDNPENDDGKRLPNDNGHAQTIDNHSTHQRLPVEGYQHLLVDYHDSPPDPHHPQDNSRHRPPIGSKRSQTHARFNQHRSINRRPINNHISRSIDHQNPPTTDHQNPPTTDHQNPPTTDHQNPPTTDHQNPPITEHQSPANDHRRNSANDHRRNSANDYHRHPQVDYEDKSLIDNLDRPSIEDGLKPPNYHHNPQGDYQDISPIDHLTNDGQSLPIDHSTRPPIIDIERPFEDSVAEHLTKRVRVLCWVLTYPDNHQVKAIHVKKTWGKRCNGLIFLSTKEDASLPAIALNATEGRSFLWGKTKAALKYVYEHYRYDFDWFLKADDDTYVILENLRHLLVNYNPYEPVYLGRLYRHSFPRKRTYMTGGAGYVLSDTALELFVKKGLNSSNHICRENDATQGEDVELGACMELLGVKAIDTRDSLGRQLFFQCMPHDLKQTVGGCPNYCPLHPVIEVRPAYCALWQGVFDRMRKRYEYSLVRKRPKKMPLYIHERISREIVNVKAILAILVLVQFSPCSPIVVDLCPESLINNREAFVDVANMDPRRFSLCFWARITERFSREMWSSFNIMILTAVLRTIL